MKNVKILHERLTMDAGSPLKVKWCDYEYFKYPLHYHSEFEIVYIVNSTGTRFIGNHIDDFTKEDLVLIGSHVPHMFRNDSVYYRGQTKERVQAIIIQFTKDFLPGELLSYPEFFKIKNLLSEALNGISFRKVKSNKPIRDKMYALLGLSGLERLLAFIEILSMMGNTPYKTLLSDEINHQILRSQGEPRLVKVLSYLNRNYVKPIYLSEIASLAAMNESAFCRFFKDNTGKSVGQYINELRVGCACRLLLQGQLSIFQVSYESGFNNISNFNRQFKKITNFTPKQYIQEFKAPIPVVQA